MLIQMHMITLLGAMTLIRYVSSQKLELDELKSEKPELLDLRR